MTNQTFPSSLSLTQLGHHADMHQRPRRTLSMIFVKHSRTRVQHLHNGSRPSLGMSAGRTWHVFSCATRFSH
jgi:hypothetical protein